MKKTRILSKIILSGLMLMVFVAFSHATETLAAFDFETPGGYSTDIAEFNTGINDYYQRLNYTTNAGDIHTKEPYANYQGDFIFCAEDVGLFDAVGTMTFDPINITGKTSLKLAALVAGQYNPDGDYETNKHISFYANIDGAGAILIGAFRGQAGTGSIPYYLYKDDNLNGVIEASETTVLTKDLTEYIFDITGTGSSLVVSIETKVTSGYEEVAYDNIRITAEAASATKPTITTTAISSVTTTSASSGGNVTSDGGASVTARGVCWNTGGTPTLSDDYTSDGTGTGSFVSSLTGLTSGETYYVRAYATNTAGTSYGSEVNFTTLTPPTITSFTPLSGAVGATVTITGTNFNTTPANNVVFF